MEMKEHFKGLLGRIEPDPDFVAAAKEAHEELRERLSSDEEVGEPHLDTFLSGSYRRSTAIGQINDVDIMFAVDIDWQNTEPEVVIAWLQAALQRYYDQVRRQPRSVRVVTPTGVKLDIVPGAPIKLRDVNGPLRIPDREAQSWVPTHPKGQLAFAKRRNKETDGYYVQLVKIAKHWRDRLGSEDQRPKSYVLESLVAEALGPTDPESHADAVVRVLEGIDGHYEDFVGSGSVPEIPDPGFPQVNVAKRWRPTEFDAFMGEVAGAAIIARRALESEDEAVSVGLWRSLFGDSFAPPD